MAPTQSTADISGKPFTFETGRYAKQAGGAVTVRYGDTVVFAAGTVAKTIRTGIDFFPLTVDFEERLYAAGKIPGSFPRREGRPSEEGILTANAASAALHISDAPFEGPIGCVRVGTVDGKLTLNPTIQQLLESDLDLVVAGTRDSVMMLEAGANQVSEELLVDALALAQTGIKALCDAQEELRKQAGKPKLIVTAPARDTNKLAPVTSFLKERLHAKLRNPDKAQRESGLDELKAEAVTKFAPEGATITADEVGAVYEDVLEEEFLRVVSETLESNGSSSMASTCGSTLALMDAGVPIKEMIAGIAMGLVTSGSKYTILTDIQGLEDHYGDMDF